MCISMMHNTIAFRDVTLDLRPKCTMNAEVKSMSPTTSWNRHVLCPSLLTLWLKHPDTCEYLTCLIIRDWLARGRHPSQLKYSPFTAITLGSNDATTDLSIRIIPRHVPADCHYALLRRSKKGIPNISDVILGSR